MYDMLLPTKHLVAGDIPTYFSGVRVRLALRALPDTVYWGFQCKQPTEVGVFPDICTISNVTPTWRALL